MIEKSDLKIIDRVCPVCGSSSDKAQTAVTAHAEPTLDNVQNIFDKWEGFHSKTCYFTYFRCTNCEVLYNNKYFDDDSINLLYSAIADNTSGAPLETHDQTQKEYARNLVKAGLQEGALIEIGPDLGLVAKAITDSSKVTELFFVEKNILSHTSLQNISKVIPTEIVTDLELLEKDVMGTAAVLVHVLDHVLLPKSTLELLHSHLKSDAKILIVVHNEGSFLRKFMRGLWPPFRLQHPHLFSPKSLKFLLENSGYTNISVKKSVNYMPLRHAYLLAAQSLGLPKNLAKLLPKVNLPLKLGNIVATAQVVG